MLQVTPVAPLSTTSVTGALHPVLPPWPGHPACLLHGGQGGGGSLCLQEDVPGRLHLGGVEEEVHEEELGFEGSD